MQEKKGFRLPVVVVLLLGVLFVVLLVNFTVSRLASQVKVVVEEVSLVAYKEIYDQRNLSSNRLIILDLRPRSEWERAFIPRSVSFDPEQLNNEEDRQKLNTYKEIMVVSNDVPAARLFVDQLKGQTWTNDKKIYLLKEPVSGWFNAGYSKGRFLLDL